MGTDKIHVTPMFERQIYTLARTLKEPLIMYDMCARDPFQFFLFK